MYVCMYCFNVVRCFGSSQIIGAMILGGVLAKEDDGITNPLSFIFFPIIVHAFDILVSSLGIMTVRANSRDEDPMAPMKRGTPHTYYIYIFSVTLVRACKLNSGIAGRSTSYPRENIEISKSRQKEACKIYSNIEFY